MTGKRKSRGKRQVEVVKKKVLRRIPLEDEGFPQDVIREISILKNVAHENIIRIGPVRRSRPLACVTLEFEYIGIDLRTYLRATSTTIESKTIKKILVQLCRGLNHCHCRGIVHRDIWHRNFVLSPTGVVKITNFCRSRVLSAGSHRTYTREVVRMWYRAPELLLGDGQYGCGIDMWAIGVVFGEMARRGEVLFPCMSEVDLMFNMFRFLGTPTEVIWPGVSLLPNYSPELLPTWAPIPVTRHDWGDLSNDGVNLLENLLRMDPRYRFTAQAALEHIYLRVENDTELLFDSDEMEAYRAVADVEG